MPRLDHVALQVSDMDHSIAFYTEVLDLPLMFRKEDPDHNEVFAYLELEGGNLELLSLVDDSGAPIPHELPAIKKPYCPHVALGVDDIDVMVDKLRAHGIPLIDGPLIIPGQVRWLYFSDPDNNVIEYVQWLDKD
jgi:lactoylglutathione lyase